MDHNVNVFSHKLSNGIDVYISTMLKSTLFIRIADLLFLIVCMKTRRSCFNTISVY